MFRPRVLLGVKPGTLFFGFFGTLSIDRDLRHPVFIGCELLPLVPMAGSVGCISGSRLLSDWIHLSLATDFFFISVSSLLFWWGYSGIKKQEAKLGLIRFLWGGTFFFNRFFIRDNTLLRSFITWTTKFIFPFLIKISHPESVQV